MGSKVRKRCDLVQTPYRRLLAASDVPEEQKEIYTGLNPAGLQRRIEDHLRALGGCPGHMGSEASTPASVTPTSEVSRGQRTLVIIRGHPQPSFNPRQHQT